MDRLNNILKQRLAAGQVVQSEHPSADTLAAFAEQNLKAPERGTVLEHLAACPACREAVILAISEVPADQTGTRPLHKPILQFPATMRWASLAAALAVAVGVGLLSHKHDSASKQARLNEAIRSAPATQPALEIAKTEPRAEAKSDVLTTSATNKPATSNEKKKPILASGRERMNRTMAASAASEPSAALGGTGDRLSVYAKLNKEKTNAPLSNQEARQKVVTTERAEVAQAVPAPPPPPPVAAAAFSDQSQDGTLNRRQTRAQSTPPSASQTVEVTAAAPVSSQSETVEILPSKVMPAAAVPGSMLKAKSARSPEGIVRWVVSDTGQLQRSLQDGATTNVEPAPSMTVRAVAAEGIEVWAAGTRSDFPAKESQQRPVLFHSSDAGKTWTKIDGPWQNPISQLSLSGKGVLTVSASDGVWITTDAGKTWVSVKTKG